MACPERPNEGSVPHWRDGAVAHIRFNRPQALNALDVPMTAAFHAACADIEADAAVRVVVIAGEGRAFLAGGDVAAMAASPEVVGSQHIEHLHGAITILNRRRVPVIAQVHGAAGAGRRQAAVAQAAGPRAARPPAGRGAGVSGLCANRRLRGRHTRLPREARTELQRAVKTK